MHEVHLIIGRDPALGRFLAAWPQARAVALEGGWQAVPLDEQLAEAIAARWPGPPRDPAFQAVPRGLEEALAAATSGGALAYMETGYFGGVGEQSAGCWINGRALGMQRSPRPGPINDALRALGVVAPAGFDEFDALGLGRRRSMDDYTSALQAS